MGKKELCNQHYSNNFVKAIGTFTMTFRYQKSINAKGQGLRPRLVGFVPWI